MTRKLLRSAILLVAIAILPVSLQADEPAKPATPNQGTLTIGIKGNSIDGTWTGSVGNGISLGSGAVFVPANSQSGVSMDGTAATVVAGPIPGMAAAMMTQSPTAGTLVPAGHDTGKVYYIITEGAGMGDSVRRLPCTGSETVLDAISQINGLSQVSGTKMWIARPSPASRDKSTILAVDWEAISKRAVNTTNYTLMPGDRLVVGQDPLIVWSNWIGKRTAPIERIMGVIGLTTSTLGGLQGKLGDDEVLKEVLRAIRQANRDVPADGKPGEMQELLREAIRAVDTGGSNDPSKPANKH
jgi:hypothetical protein